MLLLILIDMNRMYIVDNHMRKNMIVIILLLLSLVSGCNRQKYEFDYFEYEVYQYTVSIKIV